MSRLLCLAALALALCISADASATWKSCGTRLDRLATTKLSVSGSLTAGSKVTVSASGNTNLHVPLETGAWQVRIYEDGVAKSTHTEFGDLMTALKFDDPKNTTFSMAVSFTLPAKQASGKFDANIVAIDQAKANYLCLDVDYQYAAKRSFMAAIGKQYTGCTTDADCPSSYCQNAKPGVPGSCHACGDQCCQTDKDCPGSYCKNDATKMPPYYCQAPKKAPAKKAAFLAAAPKAASAYCMNDPSKKAPFYCHVPPLPATCNSDADCKSPWYNSWCMKDSSKTAPYVCKTVMPPTCTTDKDCQRGAKKAAAVVSPAVQPFIDAMASIPTAANHGPSQCPKGDVFCENASGDKGSYCKYWLDKAVCQGSNKPCKCSGCKGDDYCKSKVGASSYCKFWQIGAGRVCQYSNVPCNCK